jgi:hypothetical protein
VMTELFTCHSTTLLTPANTRQCSMFVSSGFFHKLLLDNFLISFDLDRIGDSSFKETNGYSLCLDKIKWFLFTSR